METVPTREPAAHEPTTVDQAIAAIQAFAGDPISRDDAAWLLTIWCRRGRELAAADRAAVLDALAPRAARQPRSHPPRLCSDGGFISGAGR